MNKASKIFATLTGAASAMLLSGALSAAPETIEDGAYTAEQAKAGEPLYAQHCQSCHNREFYVQSFRNRVNQPVAFMFEEILGTMPMNAPGFLPDHEYEAIFAYVLQLLDFPAGDTELSYADGMMFDVRIVAP